MLSLLLGRQLGLDSEACHSIGLGALLHDIGKLEVPSKVLLKPEPLTRPEQQLLQMHTEFGLRMGQKLILDLAQEPKLTIARSLRPSQLPLEVLEYLSPRRNLSYHIESNHKP